MKHLIDSVLLADTKRLVSLERKTTAEILSHLEEIDRRRLYADFGHASMVQFCVKELGYSESAAYRRVQSARVLREVPETLPLLVSGALTLTNAAQAKQFFKAENIQDKKAKKDVITLILGRTGNEAQAILMGKASPDSNFRRKSILRRSTAADWELTVTISDNLKCRLEKIRNLKSYSCKSWEDVLDTAVDIALKDLTKVRVPRATATGSRTPTPAMKNKLLRDAQYRCQYPGCGSQAYLQIDHVIPVAQGGRTEMGNLKVLCAAHNRRKG